MIRRVNILVEGQTEETFVNAMLSPSLQPRELYLKAILVTTKPLASRSRQERGQPGRQFKGGIGTYDKVKRDIRNVLRDKNLTAVTTMIDYYQLPSDFPGMNKLSATNGRDRVHHLETAFHEDVADPRFRPFLTLHEFEALLFAEPQVIADALGLAPAEARSLVEVRASFHSPEEIDEGPTTHPSARIAGMSKAYRKPFHGLLIAQRIGIETMRQECPHFAQWLNWLESL